MTYLGSENTGKWIMFDEKKIQSLQKENDPNRHTILIVDDEQENLVVLGGMLGKEYDILKAMDAQSALDIMQSDENRERIHLIISDQRMPQMTGVEFLEQTIALNPNAKRMILTGFMDVEAIIDAINKGEIFKFVLKPFDRQDMLLTVRLAIESYEREKEILKLNEELRVLNSSLEEKVEIRTRELNKSLEVVGRQSQQMLNDLDLAARAQRAIFPAIQVPDFLKTDYRFLPCSKVSGDIYHVTINNPDEFGLFIGDATGHGVSAAFVTIMAEMALGDLPNHATVTEVLYHLNRKLDEHLPEGLYLSGVYFHLDINGHLTVANAGHPPLLVVPAGDDETVQLTNQGLLLGLFNNRKINFRPTEYTLKPGDRLYAYTDGITEVMNDGQNIYGYQRFIDFLTEHKKRPISEVLDLLMEELDAYATNTKHNDDITIVCLEYNP